jgi:hypothetical protein
MVLLPVILNVLFVHVPVHLAKWFDLLFIAVASEPWLYAVPRPKEVELPSHLKQMNSKCARKALNIDDSLKVM